jgi:hypothetical protein
MKFDVRTLANLFIKKVSKKRNFRIIEKSAHDEGFYTAFKETKNVARDKTSKNKVA